MGPGPAESVTSPTDDCLQLLNDTKYRCRGLFWYLNVFCMYRFSYVNLLQHGVQALAEHILNLDDPSVCLPFDLLIIILLQLADPGKHLVEHR